MIGEKQQKILAFPYSNYDVLICDGAVRSGKTSIMMVAFVDWAMRCFNGCRFGICGKTVDSATKNIIAAYTQMTYANRRYSIKFRRAEKIMEVRRGNTVNIFEVFGGKDEASAALIQGRTLAGVLLDEVVLMPKSFVDQALARCSVDGARIWFSCNPGSPKHWFYTDWISKADAKNALYLHFAMTDNPSLSQKTLEKYKTYYNGVFYQRYIEGAWVLADGLVYPMFSED
ncbi:MAG: PBSX family phage terminase large subunit, partial [Butyricicoccus pullicaecorum]|nr:PBSX family phage terminase large subunit [Butyricicoccus pullicaecorum]